MIQRAESPLFGVVGPDPTDRYRYLDFKVQNSLAAGSLCIDEAQQLTTLSLEAKQRLPRPDLGFVCELEHMREICVSEILEKYSGNQDLKGSKSKTKNPLDTLG